MKPFLYRSVVLGTLVLALAAVNFSVWQRETLLREGQTVLLELAPVDPRSLMQGDYMALRFAVGRSVQAARAPLEGGGDGYAVVKRDERNVGTFARVYRDGEALAPDESRIHYRQRRHEVRIVTNAWFFQEGSGAVYAAARYGELRVADDGEALLTGMRDKDLQPLGVKADKRKH